MLTTAETISAIIRFYTAAGSASGGQIGDQELREKALFYLQEGGEKLWTYAPLWYTLRNNADDPDTVAIAQGASTGTMPALFAQFAEEGAVYIVGQPGQPALVYKDPAILNDLLSRYPAVANWPRFYSLSGRTDAGLPKIMVWPPCAQPTELAIVGYKMRAPYLVDCPVRPFVEDSGVSGNLNGTYRWLVTFKIGDDGETEAGFVYPDPQADPLSLANVKANLRSIAISPSRAVTDRKVYRTPDIGGLAANEDPLDSFGLVAAMGSLTSRYYVDDTDDASLGAPPPTPATALLTGMEQFAEEWQRSCCFEYGKAMIAQGQGDVRDAKWLKDWETEVRRQWGELKQGRNAPLSLPRYGQKFPIGRMSPVDRLRYS